MDNSETGKRDASSVAGAEVSGSVAQGMAKTSLQADSHYFPGTQDIEQKVTSGIFTQTIPDLQRQYNHLLQLTNIAAITIDKDGFITDCNRTASKLLDRPASSLLQQTFTSLLSEAEQNTFKAWIEKAWKANSDLYLPARLKHHNGKQPIIEIKCFTIADSNTAQLYISLQNTEEQIRKKETEEKYKTLIEQAYDGVLIYDLTGAIIEFNDKAHNYLGYTHEEFEKLTVTDLFFEEDIIANPIAFYKLKDRKPVVDHRRLKRKDGSGIEMELNSKMMPDGSIIVFGRDITQRIKEAAEMQRLSKIIQNSRDEIFLVNPKTLLFEYANDAALKVTQYSLDELYTMSPADLKTNISAAKLQELLTPLLKGEVKQVNFEAIHRRKDKSEYPAEIFVQLIDIGDREVFMCNTRDISEKKKAAVELAKKEKYFRTLIEHSSSAIILFDEAGDFIYQSPVVQKITGYKVSEEHQSNLLISIHPEDAPLFNKSLKEVLQKPGSTFKGEYRFRHFDGHYVWLEGTVTNLLEIEYIHALIANYQDVSERKAAEENARAERMLLRTLIDNLPDPIYVKDMLGRKVIANREDQVFMGLDNEDEALGKTDLELYPGREGISGHERDLGIMAEDKPMIDVEIFCQNRKGRHHWLLMSRIPLHNTEGKVIGLLGIGRDITVRKQMEDELVKSNERYQYVTRATFDAVWDCDIVANTVYRGEGFETLFGYNLQQSNGYIGEWEDLVHPDDIRRVMDSYNAAINGDAVNWQSEYLYKKANGDYAAVMDKAIIIRNSDGKALRIIGAMQDITQQKNTQQQLIEAEGRFRALVENSADGIAIFKDNGEPSYLSPSVKRILGFADNDPSSPGVFKVVHPDEKTMVESVFKKALANPGMPVKGEPARVANKNGEWLWLEATITNMLHAPAINGFISNFRDVTEKFLIEKRIITEKELSDSLINNLPGIFFKITDHRLSRWNKNFELLSGYFPEEISQLLPADLFISTDKEKALEFFRSSRRESTIATELQFSTKQGLPIPFYFNAISTADKDNDCIIVMGFDIRDRKEREEVLRMSNERFEYVSKATFDAIWDWDIKNDELFLGENFAKYIDKTAVAGKSNIEIWNNNIHPDDFNRVNESLDKVIKGDESIWADEYRFKMLDGKYAYVQDRGVAIRDKSGKTIRMIGAMHDITEQKRDEEKVRRLNEELAVKAYALSSSNNELEKFAYVASHDLQEPLRMISSFLQLLQRKYENQLDETAGKYIHFAVDGASRMKVLINDLLEYSRVSTAKDATGNTDMNEVMKEVKEIFMISVEESGAIIEAENLPVLPGSRKVLMIQLMQNLVGNALKYHSNKKPIIKVTANDQGSSWLFSVADNGIGIDPAFWEKIFVIFQRLHNKDEFSGTGIGLSICKKIVEMHGGRIWVEENPGGGSIFYFTISKAV